jgi:hypothetical protein
MLSLIAMVLIVFGGYSVYLAFRPGYQMLGPLLVGLALLALGFYVLPIDSEDRPDVYYRK